MESSIYQQGLQEGLAKGIQEGRTIGVLEGEQKSCQTVVRKWHPRAGARVWQAIAECADPEALKDVMINASEWDTRTILRRLTGR